MNELVSVPQVSATMREMGKQMEKVRESVWHHGMFY